MSREFYIQQSTGKVYILERSEDDVKFMAFSSGKYVGTPKGILIPIPEPKAENYVRS